MSRDHALWWVGAVGIVVCACAGAKKGTGGCMPAAQEFLVEGPAYSDCEVGRRAQLTKVPRVEVPGRTDGASGCYSAYIDVVVDSTGYLLTTSAKLLRTNNRSYADAVMRQLNEVVYEPAEKDGKRVPQLVHYKAAMSYYSVIVRAGQAPPSAQATNMVPKC